MRFLRAHFFTRSFFLALAALAVSFVASFFVPVLFAPAKFALISLAIAAAAEFVLLHRSEGIAATRRMPERLSNGDENTVEVAVTNDYPFPVSLQIIDELPFQFQKRDLVIRAHVGAGLSDRFFYKLRPVERGEYRFGALNIYASSPLGLLERRYRFAVDARVRVYPSIIQMRRYDLFAVSHRLVDAGLKKLRRVGVSFEFDQIRRYIHGDDYRTINWKATARKAELMVNQFRDERSQSVYAVIDMGRGMKMPFAGMTLLDHAINTALVIANVAIRREDKAGVITFDERVEAVLPAGRDHSQIVRILELLYNCRTGFLEPNYEHLHAEVARKISKRSLILLFTNFESLSSLQRALPSLAAMSRRHCLVAILFLNKELERFIEGPAGSLVEVYEKTVAEKFSFEKRQIAKEIERHGIRVLCTLPEHLTIDTINTYLEIKSRGLV